MIAPAARCFSGVGIAGAGDDTGAAGVGLGAVGETEGIRAAKMAHRQRAIMDSKIKMTF